MTSSSRSRCGSTLPRNRSTTATAASCSSSCASFWPAEVSNMAIPELLDALLRVPGPSGQEATAAAEWRQRGEAFAAEVDVDVNGSSWARIPGVSGGPSLAAIGHIDGIGVHITHIDDGGFLRFGQVGGWDPVNLVSQRVLLDTKNGPVLGVIGRKA